MKESTTLTTEPNMKFSEANAKLQALYNVPELQAYLTRRRKVYSFDLLSGWSCPFAKDCLSKVYQIGDKKKLVDGKDCQFRCFSASQEVAFPSAYNLREDNFNTLRKLHSTDQMVDAILSVMPSNLGVCRIHVAGDFFNQMYFDAWCTIAQIYSDCLFYAYTKSLKFWLDTKLTICDNMVLTASRGGRLDNMIDEHNLREAVVVYSPEQADRLGLEIDHDDSHAAIPEYRDQSFALLIHGIQPKGSEAAAAIKSLKENNVRFSYSK